jgi:hypothetical protein
MIMPAFDEISGAWLTIDYSNVTISGLVMYHARNNLYWSGDLSGSSALIEVIDGSNLIIDGVIFVPKKESMTFTNPTVLGMGSDSSVDISNCIFANIFFVGVSLFHSYENPKFFFTNNLFRCGEHFLFSIFFFFFFQ